MDLMEAPLEALVFRYSAALSSLCAWWLALLAAALGLWRIRSQPVETASAVSDSSLAPSRSVNAFVRTETSSNATLLTVAPAEKWDALSWHVDGAGVGGTPKGRFRAYFHVEANEEERDNSNDGAEDCDVDDDVEEAPSPRLEYSWKWEEATEARRTADLGWYRFQDLTVLNGSVVRLWDDEWRATTASSPRRRPAAGRQLVE